MEIPILQDIDAELRELFEEIETCIQNFNPIQWSFLQTRLKRAKDVYRQYEAELEMKWKHRSQKSPFIEIGKLHREKLDLLKQKIQALKDASQTQ